MHEIKIKGKKGERDQKGGQKLDQQGRESGALHDGCYAIVERIQESAGGKKESISDIHLKRAINETK